MKYLHNFFFFFYLLLLPFSTNLKEAYEIFLGKISPFKERLDNGEIIDNLGQDLLEFRDSAISN